MNISGSCQISVHQDKGELCFQSPMKGRNTHLKVLHKNQNIGIASLELPGEKLLATFINQMVASAFELPSERLFSYDRGNAKATRARQISIYLLHTGLSFSHAKISRIYNKDRTTISYACRLIEDLRDNPAFDDRILELEKTINTVLKLAAYVPSVGVRHEK